MKFATGLQIQAHIGGLVKTLLTNLVKLPFILAGSPTNFFLLIVNVSLLVLNALEKSCSASPYLVDVMCKCDSVWILPPRAFILMVL